MYFSLVIKKLKAIIFIFFAFTFHQYSFAQNASLIISNATMSLSTSTKVVVQGDVIINTSGAIINKDSLIVGGNFTNNGNGISGVGTVTFNTAGTKTIGGTSATTFNNIKVDKGTNINNTIEVTTAGGTNTGTLTLINGLFKISAAGTYQLGGTAGYTVTPTAGLHLNATSSILNTGSFTTFNEGLIRITNGTANFGTASGNEVHTQFKGLFDMSGGIANVSGRFVSSSAPTAAPLTGLTTSGTLLTGGLINVSTIGSGSALTGTFDISPGSKLVISGTPEVIFHKPSVGAADLHIEHIASGSKSLTGGTFTFGGSLTTAGSVFNAYSDVDVYKIKLNITKAAAYGRVLLAKSLVTTGLQLNQGIFVTQNNLLTVVDKAQLILPAIGATPYNSSWVATSDASGNALTTTVNAAGKFSGNVGFKIMGVNNTDTYFPVGADFVFPNRMMVNMTNAKTRDLTVVVGKGDIGNTPTPRVNRIWFVHANDDDTTGVRASVKLYFTNPGGIWPSPQDEIETGFSYTSIKLLQKDSLAVNYFIRQSSGSDVQNATMPGIGEERFAQLMPGVSAAFSGAQNGIGSFSRFSIVGGANVILPVTFIAVNAYEHGFATDIGWSVANEINIVAYELQRAGDGKLFATIGSTKAVNNGALTGKYLLPDTSPLQGTNYYRIKAVGNDGQIFYSSIVNLTSGEGSKAAMLIYPNPITKHRITLKLSNLSADNYQVLVTSLAGANIFAQKIKHNGGSVTQTIYLPANTGAGLYNVRIIGNKEQLQSVVLVTE